MRLDNRSVLITIVAVELMVSLLVVVYALAVRRARRGVAFWAAGYGQLFAGLILVAFRGMIPDIFGIVLGNLLLLGFLMFILAGLREYRGRCTPAPAFAAAFGSIALWFLYFSLLRPSALARHCVYDLAVMALGIAGAAEIARKPAPGVRILSRLVASLLLSLALVHLARLVLTIRFSASIDFLNMEPWEAVIHLSSGVMVAGLALVLILLHSSILTEELAAAARERELLVREIAHRTKNDLALVDSLISIDQMSTAERDPSCAARLGSLRDRIRCLSQAHERLSRSEDPGIVRLDEYLGVIAEGLPGGLGVRVERDFAPLEAPFSFAAPLGLIMNELATNALKYAFPDGRGGNIRLALRAAAGAARSGARVSRAELEVRDDGVGTSWPPERQGLGTMIVLSFAAKIGASIDYAFDGGSAFRLGFDLPLPPGRP